MPYYSRTTNLGNWFVQQPQGFRHDSSITPTNPIAAGSTSHKIWLRGIASLPEGLTKEVRERTKELQVAGVEVYPRWTSRIAPTAFASIMEVTYDSDGFPIGKLRDQDVLVAGRIAAIRWSGNRLVFIDLYDGTRTLQATLDHNKIGHGEVSVSCGRFRSHCRLLRRGDHVTVIGRMHKAESGMISMRASMLPKIESACLQRLPVATPIALASREGSMGRVADMLKSSEYRRTLATRSCLLQTMRTYLISRDFCEVTTPILSAAAGGASARPFQTTATEFSDRKLSLRVAPELWLKRLIIGGMNNIFEIGPSFRNEGLDRTHNPEFTTCEFYATHYTLDSLMSTTESLLTAIASDLAYRQLIGPRWHNMPSFVMGLSFPRIDFVPALNAALRLELPNLRGQDARTQLVEIFHSKQLSIPDRPTLPRLLDALSTHYLEPQCQKPTWIINIPRCMSPLSKSFVHPTVPNQQEVAARAELFMQGKEVVNCYEEENDPFLQREKFVEQQTLGQDPGTNKVDDEAMEIDEDYIRALEWGMPPTGGWGCGIERLMMLFCDKDNISDVLSFGNLRSVSRHAGKWLDKEKSSAE